MSEQYYTEARIRQIILVRILEIKTIGDMKAKYNEGYIDALNYVLEKLEWKIIEVTCPNCGTRGKFYGKEDYAVKCSECGYTFKP